MSTKTKLYLFDANVLIKFHEYAFWKQVLDRADVVLGSVIADRESRFWPAPDGTTWGIDLAPEVKAGRVKILSANAVDLAETAAHFDPVMVESIHEGELEAITLLRCWDPSEAPPMFCTSDQKAVEATCLLGLGHLPVSLEKVLDCLGISRPPGLRRHFCQSAMDAWVQQGNVARIQGRGLR